MGRKSVLTREERQVKRKGHDRKRRSDPEKLAKKCKGRTCGRGNEFKDGEGEEFPVGTTKGLIRYIEELTSKVKTREGERLPDYIDICRNIITRPI